jgi:glutathione S-transferase
MSIKLHGMTYSNYYNMVKAAMLEKGVDYEEVHVLPNQEDGFLSQSPMGKVPCLETEKGFLTESEVMLDYVDEVGSGPSLYPQDAWGKAKARELVRYLELYIELPGRRLYGDVYFGKPASDELKAEVNMVLDKGFKAFAKIAQYDPWLAGKEFGIADIYFLYALNPVLGVCKKCFDWNVIEQYPEIGTLMAKISERDSIKKVNDEQAAI